MKREKKVRNIRSMNDLYPISTKPELDQLIRVHNHNMKVIEKKLGPGGKLWQAEYAANQALRKIENLEQRIEQLIMDPGDEALE